MNHIRTLLLQHQKLHTRPQFQKSTLATMRPTTRRPKNDTAKSNGDHPNVKYTGGIIVGIWTTICGIASAIIMARD